MSETIGPEHFIHVPVFDPEDPDNTDSPSIWHAPSCGLHIEVGAHTSVEHRCGIQSEIDAIGYEALGDLAPGWYVGRHHHEATPFGSGSWTEHNTFVEMIPMVEWVAS